MQPHHKFKAFVASGSDVIQRAEAVLNAHHIAPKSLGVEYIESQDLLVLTLGYRDDEPAHPFKLTEIKIGKIELTDSAIAAAMEGAASHLAHQGVTGVICHEFYVNKVGEFFAVFLH
jgi:hypothetical protein